MRMPSMILGSLVLLAVGFFAGRRYQAGPAVNETTGAQGAASASSADDACKRQLDFSQTQLGICLAFRAESSSDRQEDPKDPKDTLDACQARAKREEHLQRLGDCYAFEEMVPLYDALFGKIELSPEEEEAARQLGPEECRRIHRFASKARAQRRSCLRGLAEVEEIPSDGVHVKAAGPAGFKERWESFPIYERPTVNICGRWVARSAEDKKRLLEQMHFGDGIHIPADAGVRMYGDELPDGGRWWGP